MYEGVRRFRFDKGPAGSVLVNLLGDEERRARHQARTALEAFSRKRWKQWKQRLPVRAEALPFSEPHFAAMALRRLKDVGEMERRLRRSSSRIAYHKLRIALKRYRYTLESFLPAKHNTWEPVLKRLQRLLGEIHDLDVLRATVQKLGRNRVSVKQKKTWLARIDRVRAERVKSYEKLVFGECPFGRPKAPRKLLWDRWRAALETLAAISLPDSAESLTSASMPAARGAAKALPSRDTPPRLS